MPLLRSGAADQEAESLAGVGDGYPLGEVPSVLSPQDDRLCLRLDLRPPTRLKAEKEALFVVRLLLSGG